jgi:hypothetical protein
MTLRPRTAVVLLLAALSLALVACGGGEKQASSSTDVGQLLNDTFSSERTIKSGKLSLSLQAEATGGSAAAQGPISVTLSGPFESQGKDELPKLDLEAKVHGAGPDTQAGVTSTGDKGFVSFNGTDYAVTDAIFAEFKKGFERAQAEADKQQGQSLATLGIDPRRWLTEPRNAGEVKVGDDDAIRITGQVDVPKLLDDLNGALQKARSLGVQGSESLPEKLTDAQKQQAADAVERLDVEIATGKEDRILRRMVIDLAVKAPAGTASSSAQSGTLKLTLEFTDVNESQDISAPANAKPLDQLLGQLGGIPGMGGSQGSGSGSSGDAGAANLEKYAQCIEQAGNDAAKARDCADLLTS